MLKLKAGGGKDSGLLWVGLTKQSSVESEGNPAGQSKSGSLGVRELVTWCGKWGGGQPATNQRTSPHTFLETWRINGTKFNGSVKSSTNLLKPTFCRIYTVRTGFF
jgi:hypothetical protein